MHRLFEAVDISGDGSIDCQEFLSMCSDKWMKAWLRAYELDADDAELLFNLLDTGSGRITSEELIFGVYRLRGLARSIDVHTVLFSMHQALTAISARLESLEELTLGVEERTAARDSHANIFANLG